MPKLKSTTPRPVRTPVTSIIIGQLDAGICITRTGTVYSLLIDGVCRDEADARDTREAFETLHRRGAEIVAMGVA